MINSGGTKEIPANRKALWKISDELMKKIDEGSYDMKLIKQIINAQDKILKSYAHELAFCKANGIKPRMKIMDGLYK